MTGEAPLRDSLSPRDLLAPRIGEEAAHRLLPGLLLATVALLAPLPFGAARGWAPSMLEIASFSALGFLLAFEGSDRPRRVLEPLLRPAAIVLAVLLFQLVPLPLGITGWLSPTAASLHRQMIDPSARWFPLSLEPHGSVVALLRLGAYAAAFVVVATASLPGRGSLYYWALMLSGAIAGVVAWLHLWSGWDTLLFGEYTPYHAMAPTRRLHWPLLNANHLASLMNVSGLLALGALLHPPLLGAPANAPAWPHRSVAAAVLVLCIATLIGTHSRGGIGSAVAGLALLSLLWPAMTSRRLLGLRVARVGLIVAIALGVAWLGWVALHPPRGNVVLAALERRDATLQVRLEILRQSLGMIRDFLAFGTGLGTYGSVFPRYQRYPLLFASVPHAHCEPLEWWSDLGAVGLAPIILLAVVFVRRVSGGGDRRKRAILAAALGGLLAHAAGDFPLRLPAIALCAAILLGLLWRDFAAVGPSETPALAWIWPDRLVAAGAFAFVLYLGTSEWRDASATGAVLAKQRVATPPAAAGGVYEQLVWQRIGSGEPAVEPGLRAVVAAPLSATAHRALAHAYRSTEMREREFRRMVACEPANRYGRIEHALMLIGFGQFAAAQREIEEGFYLDPQYGDEKLLTLEDPIDGNWPFLEAALRGVHRRVVESPEVRGEIERFEHAERVLRAARERRRRAP